MLIRRGFAALLRAERLGSPPGPYVLQAAITACHAQAHAPEETDWARIAALYQALARLTPSRVVELNRAVAVAMASGPGDGLEIVDGLASQPALAGYHHLPSVRGDLLAGWAAMTKRRPSVRRAASLTRTIPERTVLLQRAAGCTARTQQITP